MAKDDLPTDIGGADTYLDWLEDHEQLSQVLYYMYRKWAAIEISHDNAEDNDKYPQPERIIMRPGTLGSIAPAKSNDDDDEDDGGEEGGGGRAPWVITDTGDTLTTSRPELFGEYAGLGEFLNTVETMIALAVEREWREISVVGFGADFAWLVAEKINIEANQAIVQITNYTPDDNAAKYFAHILENVYQFDLAPRQG